MAEFDNLYAKKGQGNAALTLGIIGTGLSAFGNGLMNGGLGGLFGNGQAQAMDDKIDVLQSELMRERAERYTDRAICEFKSEVCSKFDKVNDTLNGLALVNNSTANTLSCLSNTVNSLSSAFNAVTITGIASTKVLTVPAS